MGSYPNGKPSDPETYIASVVAVMAEYPDEILARVVDPRLGIATTCKFLPTIVELTEALEGAMEPNRKAWRANYEQRKALPISADTKTPEERERIAKRAAELTQSLGDKKVKDTAELAREAALEMQTERLKATMEEAVKNSKLSNPPQQRAQG